MNQTSDEQLQAATIDACVEIGRRVVEDLRAMAAAPQERRIIKYYSFDIEEHLIPTIYEFFEIGRNGERFMRAFGRSMLSHQVQYIGEAVIADKQTPSDNPLIWVAAILQLASAVAAVVMAAEATLKPSEGG